MSETMKGGMSLASDHGTGARLDEDRARSILERAAALDAERSSEIDVDELRQAAAGAGISREAFDAALREGSPASDGSGTSLSTTTATAAYYIDLLKDLLGDDAEVSVVGDRVEGRGPRGVTASIDPSTGQVTGAAFTRSSLLRRLTANTLAAILPLLLSFIILAEDGDAGGAMLGGVLLTLFSVSIGTIISHRRELKELEQDADRLRRQLRRMLGSPS